LQYTITGHSKGAAKAQLNALNLLTDSELGIGIKYLEESFIYRDDLMGSFVGMSKKSEPENQGNVEAVVFESPRVFSDTTTKQANKIIGRENLVRVENRSKDGIGLDTDPVVHLTPEFLGFGHAGTTVEIEGQGTAVTRHMMSNVGEVAIPAIEEHRNNVTQKVTQKDVNDVTNPPATAFNQSKETKNDYFSKSVVDAFKDVGNAMKKGVNNVVNDVKNAWNDYWS